MGTNKQYKGYKAYDYLEAGKDYIDYPVSAGDRRVEECLLPLSPAQEARVEALAGSTVFIDAHSHPFHFPLSMEDMDDYNRQGRMKCAYEELSRSYFDGIFDNLMDGTCSIVSSALAAEDIPSYTMDTRCIAMGSGLAALFIKQGRLRCGSSIVNSKIIIHASSFSTSSKRRP